LPKKLNTVLEYRAVDLRVPFVGRAQELRVLLAHLKRGGILTLIGPGGVGKTRLAHEAIARFRETSATQAIFISLAGVAPESVTGTVLSALQLPQEPGRTALQTIVDRMRDRTAILALDNCEHAPDETASLIEALRPLSNVTIIATSQRRLDYTGEEVLAVGPFDAQDGAAFFIARAGVEPAQIDPETLHTIGTIVERVDGLAVALDLAAARLTSLSLEHLAVELEDLRPYQLRSTRGSDPRHRTIGNVIAWAFAHLSDRAKHVFGQASLFADEFDEDDLLALGDMVQGDVRPALEELVANSLTLTTEFGYRMLLPIRAVAVRHLATMRTRRALDEAFAVRMNHVAMMLREQVRIPDQTAAAVQRLHARYADFCSALAWALKRPPERLPLVSEIPTAMMAIWVEGGRFTEGLRWMERLELVASRVEPAMRGRIFYLGLCVAHAASEYHRMVENGPVTISAFTIAGDRLGLARAYNALAAASLNTGRLEEATTYVETALRFYQQLGHQRGVATALINQGGIFFDGLGDLTRAQETFRKAVAVFENGPPDALAGTAIGNLAEVEYAMGDFDAAADLSRVAMEHFEASSSPAMIAWQHQTLARCAIARGYLHIAREELLVACDLLRHSPQPLYLARGAESAARLLVASGDSNGAALLLASARRFRAERGLLPLGTLAREVAADETAVRASLGPQGWDRALKTTATWDLARLTDIVSEYLSAQPPVATG
jgi:predicted ATPase